MESLKFIVLLVLGVFLLASSPAEGVIPIPEGTCPKQGLGPCVEGCNGLYDEKCISDGLLCCSNGCGHECSEPVKGVCPNEVASGPCKDECYGLYDQKCVSQGLVCCSNDCGRVCTEPVLA